MASKNPASDQPSKTRKRIKPDKSGLYPCANGGAYELRADDGAEQFAWRAPNAAPIPVVAAVLPLVKLAELDVHADAATAVLRAYDADDESHFFLCSDGKSVALPSAGQDEVWSDFCLAPSGKQAAFAVANVDLTDAHIRVYDVATGNQVVRWPQKEDDLLVVNVSWADDQTLSCGAHDEEGEQRKFRLHLADGKIQER